MRSKKPYNRLINYLVAFVVLAIMGFVTLPSILVKNYRVSIAAGETPVKRNGFMASENNKDRGENARVPVAGVNQNALRRTDVANHKRIMDDGHEISRPESLLISAQGLHSGEWDMKPLFLIKY
ncbi:hypothetical protein ACFL9T_10855 [Thermodesulfobacteriota bacterium]